MNKLIILSSISIILAFVGACTSSSACSDATCTSGFTMTLNLPTTINVAESKITVCRNAQCLTGAFEKPGSTSNYMGAQFPDAEKTAAGASVDVKVSDNNQMWLTWNAWDKAVLTNGDVYRIELRDLSGKVLFQTEEKVANYVESSPNGVECGPVCVQAHVTR